MGNRFAHGNKAISECDRCGFRYKLRQLRNLVIKDHDVNIKVCPECWEMDHPLLKLGSFPVSDPQAIRDPRPDFTGYPESRAQIIPAPILTGTCFVGNVTVITT
jgi:NAD-dependent SIR2 family protein deacetylase